MQGNGDKQDRSKAEYGHESLVVRLTMISKTI